MQNFGNPVLSTPSIDFRAVRDQRRASLFYYDIDLTNARSAASLSALLLNVSGNVVYIDADPSGGNALIHFQDGNYDRGPVPVYASPGAIFNVPFTQLLIENTAQTGKKLRIVYGVDVDFQPGSVAQVSITGGLVDDYITKSASFFNFHLVQSNSATTGTSNRFLLKNILPTAYYRVNEIWISADFPTQNLSMWFHRTVSAPSPTNGAWNTFSGTAGAATGATSVAAITSVFNFQVGPQWINIQNQPLQIIGKSPIYIGPGNGLEVRLTNQNASTATATCTIVYDQL